MKKKAGSNNQSIEQLLTARLFGINTNLGIRTYKTTDNYRHECDYRLALTFKGQVIEPEWDCIDRGFYVQRCTNKAMREERDEVVERLLSRVQITPKGK